MAQRNAPVGNPLASRLEGRINVPMVIADVTSVSWHREPGIRRTHKLCHRWCLIPGTFCCRNGISSPNFPPLQPSGAVIYVRRVQRNKIGCIRAEY